MQRSELTTCWQYIRLVRPSDPTADEARLVRFDELLAEDRRVNRLEDSFLLWKGIIQSKLLAKCIIVCTSSITFRLSPPSVCPDGRAAQCS